MISARESGKIIIIDEIAAMEFTSPYFGEELLRCINTKRVIGTIEYRSRSSSFSQQIKSRDDVQLIEITERNRDKIPSQVLDIIKQQYGETFLK